jgi:tetratricopeptide (TPR) repeat protein
MKRAFHGIAPLAAWILFACALFGPLIDLDVGQGNVASDLAAIESLVERHTFFIDRSTFDTIDKFKQGEHFFSQKSPVFHLAGAAVYGATRAATGWTLRERTAACLRVLTLALVVAPMGCLLWMLWDHPWARRRWRGGGRARLAFVLAFALGSLATPLAITLNHYVAAAAALMMAARRLTDPGGRSPARLGLAVGFWLSLSLACDIPAAFLMGAAVGGAWLVAAIAARARDDGIGKGGIGKDGVVTPDDRWRRLAGLAAGAAPLALLYAALNFQIAGSPLPPNLHEAAMLYYPGSFWNAERDAIRSGHPGYYQASYARRLWHATLGHRGVYWMMPLLVMATWAAIALARKTRLDLPGAKKALARDGRLALGWALLLPATIALTMAWARDLGGGCYNIRHALAAVAPLYGALAHPAWAAWWRRRATRWTACALAIWGCLVAAVGLLNPWSHNVLSAWPPLENLARLALAHPRTLPTDWIGPLIDATSTVPANGWLDLGLARLENGDPARAAAALSQAIRRDPGQSLPYYHLAIALAKMGRFGEAVQVGRRLVALDPGNLGGWNNLGLMALQGGQPDEAKRAFAESERLAPDNATAMFGSLAIMDMAGQADPDAPLLAKALRLHPDDPRLQALAERWRERPSARKP